MFKMLKNKDSAGGTISIVIILSLVCSIIVAGSAVLLKPRQEEQKVYNKQENVLKVAGLLSQGTDVKATFKNQIETKYIDITSGNFVAKPNKYDSLLAVKDPEQRITLTPEDDKAGIRYRAKIAEIYLVKDTDGKVIKLVLPIYGNGLWSMIYGFVSVSPDGDTLEGITFYQQGETPGLGGEIDNPKWQAQFPGKKLFDENNNSAIVIAKGAAELNKEHGIDALSGATLTSRGMQHIFDFWFGKLGFETFLQKVKAGELNNG